MSTTSTKEAPKKTTRKKSEGQRQAEVIRESHEAWIASVKTGIEHASRTWPRRRSGTAGADVADRVPRQHAHEAGHVLAAGGEAQEPLPGQGDGLGDGVGPLAGAADAAGLDAGVPLQARQQRQEARLQRVGLGGGGGRGGAVEGGGVHGTGFLLGGSRPARRDGSAAGPRAVLATRQAGGRMLKSGAASSLMTT
jgi:hypothetical protein